MSVDPKYNGPSGYVGMLNNPISTVDPDGEEPITLAALGIAAAIGAGVSTVAYTASIALSDGGFNNWDWGQFGKGVVIGAVSGAITYGIGSYFNGVAEAGKVSKFVVEAGRMATHATFQGGLSAAQGGDFWTAFASGAVGGAVGWGTDGWESTLGRNATTIGTAMILGGATAELSGGEFWKGAAVSGIVAGANGVAHRLSLSKAERLAQKQQRQINRLQRQIRRTQKAGCPNCPGEASVVPLPIALPLLEGLGLGAIAEAIDDAITATDESLAHGVQYSLRAKKAGYYPRYEWGKKNPTGLMWLEAQEVWKIGETTRFNQATFKQYRYSETWLKTMNLDFVPEYTGNVFQIKTVQNLKILQYSISNFDLPPGNKGVQ